MKLNMNTAGVTFNAAIIVKLKKMYNNLRKYYDLNMYRSLLMIHKYSQEKAGGKVQQPMIAHRQ